MGFHACRSAARPVNSRASFMKTFLPIAAALLSGILLVLSFPPFHIGFLGWVALIPLIIACSGASRGRAAFYGWFAGAVFFIGSLYWLRNVTIVGYLALACYCALYFVPFSIFVTLRSSGWRSMAWVKNLGWMAALATVWAASEYIRSTLFTGFPWNLLAVSQYDQISLIQIAELGGVYLLSALMVFVNAGVAVTLLQYVSGLRHTGYKLHAELMTALFVLAAASSFGFTVLFAKEPEVDPIKVALIQPNIPEVGNWQLADPDVIYNQLDSLTGLAVINPDLDLIVWPETALPDFVRYSHRGADLVRRFVEKAPILVGSMDAEWHDGEQRYYNGSLLFDTSGELLATYHKQHLVLFGEYIPFDGKIAWIDALTPVDSSFQSGTETVLFNIPGDSRSFSVLICFEDTLPYLARRAALQGATWLVNQTNDSWFDPDAGSVQHIAHAVFRTVETRLPLVRCTNTGITCSIDSKGRVQQTLAPRTVGFHVASVYPADSNQPLTFYTRHGDRFAQACLLASVALFVSLTFTCRKKKHA